MKARRRIQTITYGILAAALGLAVAGGASRAESPAATIQSLLGAHRAWKTPPDTLEISGTSTRGKDSSPVRITAAALRDRITGIDKEETAFEYGVFREKKNLLTSSKAFWDNGDKVSTSSASIGFSQLDATGVYLLAQAAHAKATPAVPVEFQGARVQRIAIDRGRTEKRVGNLPIEDRFDAFVGESGLLVGLERSFYPKTSPLHYTTTYAFSDYRDTQGVLLPYRITLHLKKKLAETIEVAAYRFDTFPDPILFKPREVRSAK